MAIEKQPFVRYSLEEEYEKGDFVNIRLNKTERQWLDAIKMSHNEKKDATAFKKEAFKTFIFNSNLDKILRKKN
jgi:hypothetical protein